MFPDSYISENKMIAHVYCTVQIDGTSSTLKFEDRGTETIPCLKTYSKH